MQWLDMPSHVRRHIYRQAARLHYQDIWTRIKLPEQTGSWLQVSLQVSENKQLRILKTEADNYKTAIYKRTRLCKVHLYVRHDQKVTLSLLTNPLLLYKNMRSWVTWLSD